MGQQGALPSAEAIRSYLRRVDGWMDAFNTDMFVTAWPHDGSDGHAMLNTWIQFFAAWKEFFKDSIDDWIPSGSVYDETEEYHQELRGYWDRFQGVYKKKPTSNVPVVGKPFEIAGDLGDSSMVQVALAIAAVVAVGYLVRSVR